MKSAANDNWLHPARKALRRYLRGKRQFAADAWRKGTRLPPPPVPQLWGKVVAQVMRADEWRISYDRRSRADGANHRRIAVWKR